MPVYKDKERGTWYAQFNATDTDTGKPVQKKKRGFKTKKEATTWLAEQELMKNEPAAMTFRQLDEEYIKYKNAKPVTQREERYRVGKYVPFADKPVNTITRRDMIEFLNSLADMDISTSVKNYCIHLVKGVSQFGANVYGIPNQSTILKSFKKKQSEKVEMQVWSVEEFNRFLACVEQEDYRNCYAFMYWTGCRRGEALALRYTDFNGSTVRIHHAIQYYHEGFKDLKTDSSIREITLIPALFELLKPALNKCDEEKPFVFGGERSLPITNLQRFFLKAIKDSGVKKIRLHDLRHSFATNAINNGCNIVAVSKYLGHSTIEQTLKTYTHLMEKSSDDMLQKMNMLAG